VSPNSYWLYQSNQYDSNLQHLRDGQCRVVGEVTNASAIDNLVLLGCTQPSVLFDGIVGTKIPSNPRPVDLLIHYTWQARVGPNPFVGMTFDPPLEKLTGVTLYMYREGALNIQIPLIIMCTSSSPTFVPCTDVTLPSRPSFGNGVVVYDILLPTPPSSVIFLSITFEHQLGLDSDFEMAQWIFLSDVQVSGLQQQAIGKQTRLLHVNVHMQLHARVQSQVWSSGKVAVILCKSVATTFDLTTFFNLNFWKLHFITAWLFCYVIFYMWCFHFTCLFYTIGIIEELFNLHMTIYVYI